MRSPQHQSLRGDRLGGLSRKIGAIADAVYLVTGESALNLTQTSEQLT